MRSTRQGARFSLHRRTDTTSGIIPPACLQSRRQGVFIATLTVVTFARGFVTRAEGGIRVSKKSYTLDYQGFWREEKSTGIPSESGVYSVYSCVKTTSGVSIKKLIYIGESGDVRKRIASHGKRVDWIKHLKQGEQLCFTFAPIAGDRERVEAALINSHQPPENTEYKNAFPFDATTVSTGGKNRFLKPQFTVSRT